VGVGRDALKEKDHAGKIGAVVLAPHLEVSFGLGGAPVLGLGPSLRLRLRLLQLAHASSSTSTSTSTSSFGETAPGGCSVRRDGGSSNRGWLGGYGPVATIGAMVDNLLLERRVAVLVLALEGGVGTLEFAGSGRGGGA